MTKVKSFFDQRKGKLTVPAVLLLMCAVFAIMNPRFLSVDNILSVLRQISMLCIMACGVTFVMISGGLDLSVGSMCSIATVFWALGMTDWGLPQWAAILLTLMMGCLLGYVNGAIVTFTRMNPMIATLGTATVLEGAGYIICHGGMPIYGLPESAKTLGQGSIGPLPIPIIVMGVCLVANWFVLNRTYLGRSFYACGSNEEAARLSGINSGRIKRLAYIGAGFFTAVCGVILGSRVNSGQPAAGKEFQMNCLTACIVGGISAGGGEGNTLSVFIGALIVGVIDNGFTIIRVNEYWQQIARGLILIFAVAMDAIQRQRGDKAKRAIKRSA